MLAFLGVQVVVVGVALLHDEHAAFLVLLSTLIPLEQPHTGCVIRGTSTKLTLRGRRVSLHKSEILWSTWRASVVVAPESFPRVVIEDYCSIGSNPRNVQLSRQKFPFTPSIPSTRGWGSSTPSSSPRALHHKTGTISCEECNSTTPTTMDFDRSVYSWKTLFSF